VPSRQDPPPAAGQETDLPVSIVTGFLGSGKTTFIGRILRDPGFARTAVIINEFGEIGLDHELIASSDDSVLTLNTGCLCCAIQTDLARTLMDLHQRRAAGSADYDRVLVETSGLGDPAPILQSLMTDSAVTRTYRIGSVVTLVDSVHGTAALDRFAEARHQIALADRLLITKTDLQPVSDALEAKLDALNPGAPRMPVAQAGASAVFGETLGQDLLDRVTGMQRTTGHGGIETFTLERERPLPALALTLLLQAIAEHCGARLLRMKGFVAIEEIAGQPAVIQGVRHVFNSPEFLDAWPGGNQRTRLVFIAERIPRHFVTRLLDVIEDEVRAATAETESTSGHPRA
jgi:G3E family GTPase